MRLSTFLSTINIIKKNIVSRKWPKNLSLILIDQLKNKSEKLNSISKKTLFWYIIIIKKVKSLDNLIKLIDWILLVMEKWEIWMKKMWKKIMMKIRNNNFSNKLMKWSKNVNRKLNQMKKLLIQKEIKEETMKRVFFN